VWDAAPTSWLVPAALLGTGALAIVLGLRPVGGCCVVGALAWPGPSLVLGPTPLYAAGLVLAVLWPAAAVGAAATQQTARPRRALATSAVVALALSAVAGLVRVATYDAFLDPDCHRWCVTGPLVVWHDVGVAGAARLAAAAGAFGAAAAAAVVVVVAWRGTGPLRRRWWSGAMSTAALLALGGEALVTLVRPAVRPEAPVQPWLAAHTVTGAAVLAIGAGAVLGRLLLLRSLGEARRHLAQPDPASATSLLARALRDPDVVVGHHVGDGLVVDAANRVMGPPRPGRRPTPELHDGDVTAVIDHDERIQGIVI
jgi:hypothetical protein